MINPCSAPDSLKVFSGRFFRKRRILRHFPDNPADLFFSTQDKYKLNPRILYDVENNHKSNSVTYNQI